MKEDVKMVDETQNGVKVQTYNIGDIVTGTVSKVEEKHVLVDFGYKHDGILPIGEISNVHIEKAGDVISTGDQVTLKVTKVTDDEIILSKKAVDNEKAWEILEQRLSTGEQFEVTVADVVKGGLVADVGARAFIPASQVEVTFVEDFTDYKGKTLRVKVIELDQEKNKVILSQRAVLEEEATKEKQDVLGTLRTGEIIEGTVRRLTNFGAFVDIGGVDGLVHISELAWNRVETPSDVVSEGEKVKVKILKVDSENGKISLSIKEAGESPWKKAVSEIKIGDTVKGVVRRLVSFGAFVEITPGVEGLVHISQIANRHISSPGEVLKEGQEVEAKVLDVNQQDQKISLSIRELIEDEHQSYTKDYVAQETTGMGITLGDVIGDKLRKLK
jgi:small subunit ribosomal protein S1